MKLSIRAKVILQTIVIITVLATVIILIVKNSLLSYMMQETITNSELLGLEMINLKYPGSWKLENDILYKGDHPLNNDFETVDIIAKGLGNGANATIFLLDKNNKYITDENNAYVRISTTIYSENDSTKRAVGTKLIEKVKNVINEDKVYTGEVKILGKDYLTRYTPLKNSSGEIIGIWFVGLEKQIIIKDINKIILSVLITTIIIIIGAIIINVLFTNRMGKDIMKINNSLKQLAIGNFSIKTNITSRDELGELGKSLESVIKQMNHQTKSMESVARGELNELVEIKSEHDKLSLSINEVIETIQELISDMKHMIISHEQGEIDEFVDVNKYNGSFKELAAGVNGLAKDYIDLTKDAMACVNSIGNGNFNAEIITYPGKKVFINNSIEELRHNLTLVNSEVKTLINKSIDGELHHRITTTNFVGDWKLLTAGVNDLIDTIVSPINEAIDVLTKISNGDLNARVIGNYKGDHALIKDRLNFMGNNINSYIIEISEVLKKTSDGDLSTKIEKQYIGDFKALKDSINNIIEEFSKIIVDINLSSENLSNSAQEVSYLSATLSSGATEQAASVEEVSATVSQIAEQVERNSTQVNQVNVLANESKSAVVICDHLMTELKDQMDEINKINVEVTKILKMINDIAFQTNILSLNAAVEAARAGIEGKGFAVIADDVRNLSLKTSKAADETTTMISDISTKIKSGAALTNKTAESLRNILKSSTDVVAITGKVVEDTNEQNVAIKQISESMKQISDVVHSTSVSAHQGALASSELSSLAKTLINIVSSFKL